MITKSALHLHKIYLGLYSWYKAQQLGLKKAHTFSVYERDFYITMFQTLQGKDIIVYDIGAARGVVTQCLNKLENVKKIHAFEPLPDFYNALEKFAKQEQKINVHNVALGNESGVLEINVSNWQTSSSLLPMNSFFQEQIKGVDIKEKVNINVARLDEYRESNQLDYPNVVKIDVQGYEKNVIEGGKETISKAEFIIVEMSLKQLYENSPLFDDLYRYIISLGFQLIGLSTPMVGKKGIQLQVDGIFENQNKRF